MVSEIKDKVRLTFFGEFHIFVARRKLLYEYATFVQKRSLVCGLKILVESKVQVPGDFYRVRITTTSQLS